MFHFFCVTLHRFCVCDFEFCFVYNTKGQKEFSKDNKYACHTKEKVIELFYNGFEILR